MAIREPIIKHTDVKFNINFMKIWQAIKDYSPNILKTPLVLLNGILTYLNKLIIFGLFLILLGQTVHILNGNERRYINLRHLLIKWINLVIIIILASYVKKHTSYNELFEFMCNMLAVAMVYPSKFIKNLHLKYFSFSERKKYEENSEDASEVDMSLFTRMLSSMTIFFLNICRFMITFIAPTHRKKIEQAMRGVNLVIVEEKYFWKMYQTSAKSSIIIPNTANQNGPSFQGGNNMAKSAVQTQKNSTDLTKQIPRSPRSVQSIKQNSIRAKVSEYIEIPITSMHSIAQKKFTFYRNIEIVYFCETGQLNIVNEEDGKSSNHALTELAQENNLILRFGFENEDQPVFVKFRSKKEYDLFYNTLYLQAQYQETK